MLLFLLETYNSFTTSPKPSVAIPAKLVFIFGSCLSFLNVISKRNHLKYFLRVIHTVPAQAVICILCEYLNSNAIFGEHKVQCLNSRLSQWEACVRSLSLRERKCSLKSWLCLSNMYNMVNFTVLLSVYEEQMVLQNLSDGLADVFFFTPTCILHFNTSFPQTFSRNIFFCFVCSLLLLHIYVRECLSA
jgi:hypothetical protein